MFFKIVDFDSFHFNKELYPPCEGAIWCEDIKGWVIEFNTIESLVDWCDKNGEDIIINFKRDGDLYNEISINFGFVE